MKIKNILMLILALCMIFSLCACGNTSGNTDETPAPNTQEETQESTKADDGKVTYTVTVVDESGNPVAGVMVQACNDNGCVPFMTPTDANGVTTWELVDADYEIKFMSKPDGYADDTTGYPIAAGTHEITLTLKTAS